jgi:hypothetical protein
MACSVASKLMRARWRKKCCPSSAFRVPQRATLAHRTSPALRHFTDQVTGALSRVARIVFRWIHSTDPLFACFLERASEMNDVQSFQPQDEPC